MIRPSIFTLATLFFILTSSNQVSAQRTMGGEPHDWGKADVLKRTIPSFDLGPANKATVREIAEEQSASDQQFRYGYQRLLSVDVLNEGKWFDKKRGGRYCLYSVKSPGAAMLSVQFSDFDLEPGAMLYLYNADRTEFLGGFNESNELPTGDFATAVVQGEEVIIEYHEPVNRREKDRKLIVEGVTHGVLDIFELNKRHKGGNGQTKDYWPGYPSGPCHNNVVCPIANGWEDQISSVAMFLRPDGGGCTGLMVNNTANDGTPYFYLANHCYQPTESQWVFYFNYESPTCIGDTGQTVETIVGAYYRAAEHFADFVLVELFNSPELVYDVYYSGWDRDTIVSPTSGATIMHPAFDVKKITMDYDQFGQGLGNSIGGSTPTWVLQFDTGIVEHGASGGPIFNQDRRLIGNLADAWGDCTTSAGVISSKFGFQWENGPTQAQRLKEWLDPGNTGATFVDGYGSSAPQGITLPVKAYLEGPYDGATGLMKDDLRLANLVPLAEPYTAMGYAHVGGGAEVTSAAMLQVTGDSAVIDWMVVELRNQFDSTQIIASQSVLLLSNGALVATDGSTPSFSLPADNYYVALRHRNHIDVMSAGPIALTSSSSEVNLSDGSVPIYGGSSIVMNSVGSTNVLINGDVNSDIAIKYAGAANDRDPILIAVGGGVPTNTVSGYRVEDVNLDGMIKYVGGANDRDVILMTIGGSIPTAVRVGQLP